MQETLFIIKPDGVERGLAGEVLRRIERRGFKLTRIKMLQASKEILAKHYEDLLEKPFYHQIETYMLEGPIIVGTFTGSDAVKTWRKTMGVTNPAEAELGSIRADFAQGPDENGDMRNMVHGSDSVEAAKREIEIWFGEQKRKSISILGLFEYDFISYEYPSGSCCKYVRMTGRSIINFVN